MRDLPVQLSDTSARRSVYNEETSDGCRIHRCRPMTSRVSVSGRDAALTPPQGDSRRATWLLMTLFSSGRPSPTSALLLQSSVCQQEPRRVGASTSGAAGRYSVKCDVGALERKTGPRHRLGRTWIMRSAIVFTLGASLVESSAGSRSVGRLKHSGRRKRIRWKPRAVRRLASHTPAESRVSGRGARRVSRPRGIRAQRPSAAPRPIADCRPVERPARCC
jgi:hypothetical protein